MKNVSYIKKLKLLNFFNKTISENKLNLEEKFNIRIDGAKRLYTVVNIPIDAVGEEYSLRKADVDKIAEKYIKDYVADLSEYFNSINLNELYRFYDIKKVDKYSYLVVIGFSLLKTHKFYSNIYYRIIPSVIIIGLVLFYIFKN
jgi:hypothetical protein